MVSGPREAGVDMTPIVCVLRTTSAPAQGEIAYSSDWRHFRSIKAGSRRVPWLCLDLEFKDTREPQVYSPFILYCTAVLPVSTPPHIGTAL
jgi:hypothetical protein